MSLVVRLPVTSCGECRCVLSYWDVWHPERTVTPRNQGVNICVTDDDHQADNSSRHANGYWIPSLTWHHLNKISHKSQVILSKASKCWWAKVESQNLPNQRSRFAGLFLRTKIQPWLRWIASLPFVTEKGWMFKNRFWKRKQKPDH